MDETIVKIGVWMFLAGILIGVIAMATVLIRGFVGNMRKRELYSALWSMILFLLLCGVVIIGIGLLIHKEFFAALVS